MKKSILFATAFIFCFSTFGAHAGEKKECDFYDHNCKEKREIRFNDTVPKEDRVRMQAPPRNQKYIKNDGTKSLSDIQAEQLKPR